MAAVSANWHFDKADYINNTPSRRDGISLAEERITRKVGMKFLLNVSWNLKIPQSTIATAATYYHRFFMLRSFKKYHKYEIAGACILLACKTEETMRKISQVSSGCAKFARRDHSPYTKNEKEKEIEAWSKTIKKREPMIAATLCFDLSIKKPYQVLLDFLKSLEGVDKEVLQNFATNAWAIINDSYLTPMCLFHKPETIASAAIYLAAQMIDLQLNIDPSNGLLCWWEVTDCNVRELGICVQEILESYRIPRGEEMSPDVQENGNSISTNISRTADNNLNGEAINSGSTTPLNMNHMTHVEIRNGVHTPYENSSPSSNTLMNGVTPAQDDEMEDGQIVEDDTGTTANGQLEEDDEMNLV